MKIKNINITLLGNNSGRNLGDAAILSSILDVFTKLLKNAKFYVPSILPDFINSNYGNNYNVRGINIMPWTLSIRLLGIPTFYCIARSNIVMICDGIIFGRKLFSPHNFLITLIFLAPWAKLCGCKLICFCCGIGPFPTEISKKFARWVLNLCDVIIMRENDSKKLAEAIGVKRNIEIAGDAAFLNKVSENKVYDEIAKLENIDKSRNLIGINVTTYLDSWLEKDERLKNKSDFISTVTQGILIAKQKIEKENEIQFLIFSTSPMDEAISKSVAESISGILLTNTKYISHDIQGVMTKCSLLIGMRLHSLILASSAGVPIVAINYAPKVRSYMKLLGCENYGIELSKFTSHNLSERITKAWKNKSVLREKQQKVVIKLRKEAYSAAVQVANLVS